MEPELIADYQCVVGEGPLWHEDEQRLYWSDIVTGRLFRYDPATGQHEQIYAGEQVGGFTIQEDGTLGAAAALCATRRTAGSFSESASPLARSPAPPSAVRT